MVASLSFVEEAFSPGVSCGILNAKHDEVSSLCGACSSGDPPRFCRLSGLFYALKQFFQNRVKHIFSISIMCYDMTFVKTIMYTLPCQEYQNKFCRHWIYPQRPLVNDLPEYGKQRTYTRRTRKKDRDKQDLLSLTMRKIDLEFMMKCLSELHWPYRLQLMTY